MQAEIKKQTNKQTKQLRKNEKISSRTNDHPSRFQDRLRPCLIAGEAETVKPRGVERSSRTSRGGRRLGLSVYGYSEAVT